MSAMNWPITVEINRRHLTTGSKGDPWGCPTALAIQEALDLPEGRVRVNGREAFIRTIENGEFVNNTALLPQSVREFIWSFDNGKIIDPIVFHLNIQKYRP